MPQVTWVPRITEMDYKKSQYKITENNVKKKLGTTYLFKTPKQGF